MLFICLLETLSQNVTSMTECANYHGQAYGRENWILSVSCWKLIRRVTYCVCSSAQMKFYVGSTDSE